MAADGATRHFTAVPLKQSSLQAPMSTRSRRACPITLFHPDNTSWTPVPRFLTPRRGVGGVACRPFIALARAVLAHDDRVTAALLGQNEQNAPDGGAPAVAVSAAPGRFYWFDVFAISQHASHYQHDDLQLLGEVSVRTGAQDRSTVQVYRCPGY
jgi:hypothetical protein